MTALRTAARNSSPQLFAFAANQEPLPAVLPKRVRAKFCLQEFSNKFQSKNTKVKGTVFEGGAGITHLFAPMLR
jgi:hypothetical protein